MKIKTIYKLSPSFIVVILLCQVMNVKAQSDSGFIYGKVTTTDNNSYTGAIRWGKEEAFWFDMFNSSKPRNNNLRYLSAEDLDYINRDNERWASKWTNIVINTKWSWNKSHTHSFACNFGDIEFLEIVGRNRIELGLKNGEILKLEGGSNDIGAKVSVYDNEVGVVKIKWDRIEYIEFMDTPKQLEYKFGKPLFGTVETDNGEFTGFIQWDHDERLSTDKLDGDNSDGDMTIQFGKIESIERDGRGSKVTLRSGREFYLTGSNDVNNENRGIIVNMPGQGRVDIEWRDFRKVTFRKESRDSGPSYASYKTPKYISGTVKTKDGSSLTGRIIYDLDEKYDMEILQGMDEGIEYLVPFREIKSISPKNYSYTRIEFNNGKKVLLSDSQDVTEENDGVLVFNGKGDPTYVRWDNIDEIIFN